MGQRRYGFAPTQSDSLLARPQQDFPKTRSDPISPGDVPIHNPCRHMRLWKRNLATRQPRLATAPSLANIVIGSNKRAQPPDPYLTWAHAVMDPHLGSPAAALVARGMPFQKRDRIRKAPAASRHRIQMGQHSYGFAPMQPDSLLDRPQQDFPKNDIGSDKLRRCPYP